MNETVLPDEIEAISSIDANPLKQIPFELYDKQYRKTTKLADIDTARDPLKGRSDWYEFDFTEPVFLGKITVDVENYDYKDCEFRWVSVSSGEQLLSVARFKDGAFSTEIDDFVLGFAFKPDKKYYGDPKLLGVKAEGFSLNDFLSGREKIYRISSLKRAAITDAQQVIDEAKSSKDELVANHLEVEASKANQREIQKAISGLQKSEDSLKETIVSLDKTISEKKAEQSGLEARLERQESLIQERTIERDRLNKEVNSKTAELKDLEADIDLFPAEIKKFAERGSEHKSFYWKLAALPILVLVAMACLLLFDAHNLAPVLEENDKGRVFSIFLTRLPYVIVATGIIGVMFTIAQGLISEIIRIDTQTRSLARLNIIASDVNFASADGLSLTDEEKYHLRTGLKMDLFREHLKADVPTEFDYLDSQRVKSRLAFLKKQREERPSSEEVPPESASNGEHEEEH